MAGLAYTVERVAVERIFALRKAVLRPYLPDDDPYLLPDDHLPTTVAFGALTPEDEVIGIGRLTPEPPPFEATRGRSWRLRNMATSSEMRNRGVGSAVLRALVGHIAESGGGILWCNARLGALGLYERAGMQRWGEVWEDPHSGPHVVMWRDIL